MTPWFIPTPIANQPWRVFLPLFMLVALGFAVLYSAGGGSVSPYADSYLVRFTVFFVMAVVISRLPEDLFKFMAYPAYGGTLLLLMLVEAIGGMGGGSQRWLELGFMRLQPSELMKPVIVLVLAYFYSTLPAAMTASLRGLLPALGLIGLPVGLVILQPDLGTALAILFGGGVVLFVAGLPLRWFLGAGGLAAVAAPLAYFFVLHDYQRRRVTTFLDPESDPLGAGYHITQSKIAIGSGGLTGKGFGNGSQSHLEYLPEAHTDFAFATMAEEWGLIGGFFVLLVFAVLLTWGMNVARRAPDRFGMLLGTGMTATIFFYVAVNLMMVMGLAPVVGIPLPFLSHGGSSMLTVMICFGTLLAIDRWRKKPGLGQSR